MWNWFRRTWPPKCVICGNTYTKPDEWRSKARPSCQRDVIDADQYNVLSSGVYCVRCGKQKTPTGHMAEIGFDQATGRREWYMEYQCPDHRTWVGSMLVATLATARG